MYVLQRKVLFRHQEVTVEGSIPFCPWPEGHAIMHLVVVNKGVGYLELIEQLAGARYRANELFAQSIASVKQRPM